MRYLFSITKSNVRIKFEYNKPINTFYCNLLFLFLFLIGIIILRAMKLHSNK